MSEANIPTSQATAPMSETNATPIADYNSINLRLSHPNLYHSIMTFAVLSIGLGLNLLFYKLKPPNGYGIPQELAAITFIALGVAKIFFLNIRRNLIIVRFTMALEVGWMLFWGLGTGVTWYQGKTSLQQLILYVGLAVFEMWLLIEPFANPLTGKKGA